MSDEDIRAKAQIIADATGRDVEAVIEDLLDDGVVNLSNEADTTPDLVTQLKEAAELITTVQAISQEVSQNTVLNGGENSTEVKVETTLEGDIVDRAIASAQRKADDIKKLILTLTPIFLLITGSGMEAFGITNFIDSEEDDYDPDYYVEYGACMNPDAVNYDEFASWDDGSCEFDDSGGGGGPPCNWVWDDTSYTNDNMPDSLYVRVSFSSVQCEYELEGDFEVHLMRDGEHYDMEEVFHAKFFENYDLEYQFDDLEPGIYTIHTSFDSYEGSEWHWDSPRDYRFEASCEPNWIWSNEAIYDFDNDGQGFNNDLKVQVRFMDDNKCDIHMDNGYFQVNVDGYETRTINNNFHDEFFIDETFVNLPEGNYFVDVDYFTNDGSSWNGPDAWVTMEGESQQNVECNPYVYSLQLFVQSVNQENTVNVDSDLDCSNVDGSQEITVFFAVYENGSDISQPPLKSNFDNYTISGAEYDVKSILLEDFEVANNNKYDFFWVAIWETGSTDYQWLDVEIGEIESQSEPCENLTLVSNGITLSNDSNDLSFVWDLKHDGPNDRDCFVEIEVMVTLYQNGTYYNVSDFSSNGIHKIYANSSLFVDKSSVSLFGGLSAGEYEVLLKYRIVGDSNASQDYFANKVFIE